MIVTAYTNDGDIYQLEGSKAESLYAKISEMTPENIRYYSAVYLDNDSCTHCDTTYFPSYDEAMKWYEMAKIAFPVGLADNDDLAEIFNADFVKRMTMAWIAFGITERQGGFWVLQ